MAEFEHLEEMVVGLYDRGILGCAKTREGFIKLKSGRMSPHYANFRGLMSFDVSLAISSQMTVPKQRRVRELTIDAAAAAVDDLKSTKRFGFDHLAPIPQAVTQLGGAVALRAGVSSVNVRVPEGEKGYGKHKPVEGDYRQGDVVLGFDDVVTTGEAKTEFLEPVKMAGLEVLEFLVILDREEGGASKIEAEGYGLESVVGMFAVRNILADHNRLSSQQADFITEYLDEYGGY